jgi:hypothetical protein
MTDSEPIRPPEPVTIAMEVKDASVWGPGGRPL